MNSLPMESYPWPAVVEFGRETCGDLRSAEAHEWLVTNGIGGFACGTLAGTLTRRYHGLLMAALPPYWNRDLLVSKIDEVVDYDGRNYALGANRWSGGIIDPQGYVQIERFYLAGTTPVWVFACADALLEKRIWMEQGANSTYVQYRLVRARQPVRMAMKVLVNSRDYHGLTQEPDLHFHVQQTEGGLCVLGGATPIYLRSAEAAAQPAATWYNHFELATEKLRGLNYREDHFHAATFLVELRCGESVSLVASTDPAANLDGQSALRARTSRDNALLDRKHHPGLADPPAWIKHLMLAADQFIVRRPLTDGSRVTSVIAGYPWFGDWGRDTLVSLPGLLLATGRPEVAAEVLRHYARFMDRGMLPNRFPDAGDAPEYNSVDAALWFFEVLRRYFASTHDWALLREIYSATAQIIDAFMRGTRFSIHQDPADGLLYAGEPGVQLTWMDSKIGDWVVTPRTGKPVEVNALWLNALATQIRFAQQLGHPATVYESTLARARDGFQRFWNPAAKCCFDVIDGPQGNDASVRPNQILAVALEESALTPDQQRSIVEICARELLTSFGLRSLSPADSRYRGNYRGDVLQRDSSYHQGTAWGWLIGPFVQAFLRVTGDVQQALTYLAPFENHLTVCGLGTASEIFDGDPPHAPQGCFAQAWTVAEILRSWMSIQAVTPEAPSSK